jgi:hypothetical protein
MTQQASLRLDAADTAYLDLELRHVDPVHYKKLVAGILGRKYIPLIEGVPSHVNEYSYKMVEMTGNGDEAKPGAPHGNDATVVGVKFTDHTSAIQQIPVEMKWTVRELQQSAKLGGHLEQATIHAAMTYIARRRDHMLAFGVTGSTIKGLLNHSTIAATTPSTKTGTGAGTAWIRTVAVSPDEILADIAKMVSETRAALNQASMSPGGDNIPAFDRFVLLLDSANYTYIAQTPRSTTSDRTILQWAMQQNPWLESIEEWNKCNLANTAGNGPRALLYPRDPMAVGCIIPDEWTQLAWQYAGHNIVVPANGSCGGTIVRYGVACRKMDGI